MDLYSFFIGFLTATCLYIAVKKITQEAYFKNTNVIVKKTDIEDIKKNISLSLDYLFHFEDYFNNIEQKLRKKKNGN